MSKEPIALALLRNIYLSGGGRFSIPADSVSEDWHKMLSHLYDEALIPDEFDSPVAYYESLKLNLKLQNGIYQVSLEIDKNDLDTIPF